MERLAPVLDAIAASPAEDHSAAAMANRLGVSVRHLGRLFTQHTGTTPARYVELARVTAAKGLPTGDRAPLGEVAARAGFGSAETMRRAYLRTVGITPGAYRQRHGMSRSEGELSLRQGPNRRTLELEVKARPRRAQTHREYLPRKLFPADLTSQTRSSLASAT